MKNHLAGGKITSNHTTIIEAARPLVRHAEKLEYVTKIALGIIEQIGKTRTRHTKITEIPAGLKIVVRSNVCRQEIIIYTNDKNRTKAELLQCQPTDHRSLHLI